MNNSLNNWTTIITPKHKWFNLNLKEVWDYKDLIVLFVRRDLIAIYKQTVLGPIWFLIGPLFTVFTYTFLFKGIANLSTDDLPAPLFYLAGTTLWNYFQSSFNGTSSTFLSNSGIFGKVYFPRLVSPISLIISNLLKFTMQMLTFLGFLIYYKYTSPGLINIHWSIVLTPIYILVVGGLALGGGIIVSSLTTKYRDLNQFVGVFITLLMFMSPIMYPLSKAKLFKEYLKFNPMAHLIEAFRFAFTGHGEINIYGLIYSGITMILVLLIGIILFNKTEKNFMDTI
jgi:lipopolysaccharide transport system permease protein